MSGTAEPQPEPRWPLYLQRTDHWDLYDQEKRVACACRTLEVLWQQEHLDGGVVAALARCCECSRRWEWIA